MDFPSCQIKSLFYYMSWPISILLLQLELQLNLAKAANKISILSEVTFLWNSAYLWELPIHS